MHEMVHYVLTIAEDVQNLKPVQSSKFHFLYISPACIPLKALSL